MHHLQKNANKLSRTCKLYPRVDSEGLLTEHLELSDVVNFDCYESIVGSTRRILGKFIGVTPECIDINALYYYKKRARSTRLNPVSLQTTTDGFRAIAEHPIGEVPLGVKWSQKYVTRPGGQNVLVKVEQQTDEKQEESTTELRKKMSAQRRSSSENEVPEKKRKLESPSLKLFKLNYEELKTGVKVLDPTRQSLNSGNPEAQNSTDGTAAGNQQKGLFGSPSVLNINVQKDKDTSEVEDDAERRYVYPHKSQYQWPEDASLEVVMNYDGITERKTLMPGLAYVVQSIMKGNYSVLSREVAASLCLTKTSGTQQDVLNELNQTNVKSHGPNIKEASAKKVSIRYLKDAKMEIFKILSMLSLSKSRFKQLLHWMKRLKLEEGKLGKFYLSERGVVGKGLQVTYDTNEEAAMKLNQIYKARQQQNAAKVLHPIDPIPTHANLQVTTETGDRIMFLLPQTTAADTVPKTSTRTVEILNTAQGLVDVTSTTKPVSVSSSSSTQPQPEEETSSNKSSPGYTLPTILRRKLRHTVQKTHEKSPSPTPIQLYRSIPNEQNSDNVEPSQSIESNSNQTLQFVKQEPVDYSSDAADDYERNLNKALSPSTGMFRETQPTYSDVLKSDAPMPQSSEQNEKPFDIVIKTEPLDDY